VLVISTRVAKPAIVARRLLAVAIGAVLLLIGCAYSPHGTVNDALGLRVAGNRLIDAQGRATRLLGVSVSGTEYACISRLGIFAAPTTGKAIDAMMSWRINTVRIPLNEDCWLGINGAPARYSGARYQAAIHGYVTRLNHAGLHVILDLHWNAAGTTMATGQQQMADLSHSPAFWSSVARTFSADPGVVFDLYNEPHDISWRCWRDGCMMPAGWPAAGMQSLVNAVRRTGARQPVIAAGLSSGNDLSQWLRYRPHDPADQLVAGLHMYNFHACTTVDCWNRTVTPVTHAAPVVTTELGEGDCSATFISRFMTWADATGVSYLGWSWNPVGCGAPALISSWSGAPTPYGAGLRYHLCQLSLRQRECRAVVRRL